MKKKSLLILSSILGAIVGIGIYERTRQIQKKNRQAGTHIPYGPYEAVFKRPLDIVLSAAALIVLSPLLAVIGLLVKIKLGSPVIFKQLRPGLNEKLFQIYKFRTMLAPQTKDGKVITDEERVACIEKGIEVLSDEERLTNFGKFLRAASLDELPELLNIFKGEMAIVGPRPLATIYLPYYIEEEKKRHDVRPGLTGLAQVNGRNSVSWDDKLAYDVEYASHITFWGDVKILFKTIFVVLKEENIGQGVQQPESLCVVRQRRI